MMLKSFVPFHIFVETVILFSEWCINIKLEISAKIILVLFFIYFALIMLFKILYLFKLFILTNNYHLYL